MYSLHRGVQGGAKSATACITSLHVAGENNIGRFLFGSFNPDCQTTKLSNLFSGYTVLHVTLTFYRWYRDSRIPKASGKLWQSYLPPWCCPGCRRTCWQTLCEEADHKRDTREGNFTHCNQHWEDENYHCCCSYSGWNWTSKLPQVLTRS